MRAVRFHAHGGPDVLQLDQVAVPEPGPGEVLIEVEAIGANAIDAVLRRGGTPWDRPLPGTLTGDVVGRISKLGPDTPAGTEVGQRVAVLTEDAFADFAVADAAFLAPIPDHADAGEATMMSMTAPLALRLLEAGRVPAGGTVLIQSAARHHRPPRRPTGPLLRPEDDHRYGVLGRAARLHPGSSAPKPST